MLYIQRNIKNHMSINQALTSAYQKLNNKKINSAHLDAELLLSFVIKKSREYILAHSNKKLTLTQIKKYNNLIKQRAKNIPIAYLTHEKEFYGRKFYVDERVLVPRPETEMFIDIVETRHGASLREGKTTIIDIGTGSGCIIITLAKELQNKNIKFLATDISKNALSVAKKNARLHNVNKKIKFLHGNLLEPILKNKNFLLHASNLQLVANLPYLTPTQIKNSPSIKHEPKLALTAGKDGLKYYRELSAQIKTLQKLNPKIKITLLCEIDPVQVKGIKKIFSFAKNVEIKKDLADLNRIPIIKI